jgi:putative phosphoribosyl transferase
VNAVKQAQDAFDATVLTPMDVLYEDRRDAGRQLAASLRQYAGRADVLALGLPRGGVPVAYEVARALNAPLDVFLVRKLGTPGQEELALGAIASGGVEVLNDAVIRELGIPEETIAAVSARERRELDRRERAFRGELPPVDVAGKTVILIDDGLATGSTMRAAARSLNQMRRARLVIAVPVAAQMVCQSLRREADEIVCLRSPDNFFAVGQWYRNFEQITDAEVRRLLELRRREVRSGASEKSPIEEH